MLHETLPNLFSWQTLHSFACRLVLFHFSLMVGALSCIFDVVAPLLQQCGLLYASCPWKKASALGGRCCCTVWWSSRWRLKSHEVHKYIRYNFFALIFKYLLPAPWIHYLENLEDFFGIRFFFVKVKSLEISLQRFHIIYKRRCEILHNINSCDSSVGRAIGSDPHG